jgi:hypothetical protein
MKKTLLLLVIAGSIIAGMASCKKEETPALAIMQTVDVNLKAGESYTFSLPKNLHNDPYEITTQAKHASVSQLCEDSSGAHIYKYTPEANYSGSDQVIVSNDQKHNSNCTASQGPPPAGTEHGDCNGDKEDHYVITLNFTVKDTVSTNK